MDTIVNNNKIRVKVSSYALLDVLRALHNENVKDVTVTKEDNELILIVDTSRNFGYQGGCYVKVDEHGYPDIGGSVTSTECPYELKASGVTLHG